MVEECIFCRIVAGEIPAKKVYADDSIIAFHDINPQAPTHILVIPRKHIANMNEATEEDRALLGHMMLRAVEIAADAGLAESGYRLAMNTGADARQSVFHIHLHILGGHPLSSRMA